MVKGAEQSASKFFMLLATLQKDFGPDIEMKEGTDIFHKSFFHVMNLF
jgi:hypothetical protein